MATRVEYLREAHWCSVSCVCPECLVKDGKFLAPECYGWERLQVSFGSRPNLPPAAPRCDTGHIDLRDQIG